MIGAILVVNMFSYGQFSIEEVVNNLSIPLASSIKYIPQPMDCLRSCAIIKTQGHSGSTITPSSKPAIVFNERSWLLDSRKDAMKHIFTYFLVWKELQLLSNDDVRAVRGTVFPEMLPGAGL